MHLLLKWTCLLNVLLVLPTAILSSKLCHQAVVYLEEFQRTFPNIDVKTQKIFDFVANEDNLRKMMLLNGLACREKQLGIRSGRVTRSVYKLMALPIDIRYSTPVATTNSFESDDDRYGYIHKSEYDNCNMTSSELALSHGWDYSPYIPPGESTTEFIFPSWNYDGKVPAAFWKEWTGHETDLEQTYITLPDNYYGYTDKESLSIHSWGQLYDAFWDTVYSIPHRCDNYTSIYSCLQGDAVTDPNVIDPLDDPVD